MMTRLTERGIPFCKPEVLPVDERTTDIRELYNIGLMLKTDEQSVPSDVRFDDSGAGCGVDRSEQWWQNNVFAECGAGTGDVPNRDCLSRRRQRG